MKLHQLIELMDPDTPVCIEYRFEAIKYYSVSELLDDYMFYEEIRNIEIETIWHSQNLYQCIVIKLKLY